MTVIKLGPDGRARCIYTEEIDLTKLGKLRVERASSIEWNLRAQLWVVRNRKGRALHVSKSRDDCLSWERKNQEKLLP